jgi:hypothetical protein
MVEEMTKARFIEVMRSERERWEALLAQVGQGELEGSKQAKDWAEKSRNGMINTM